MTKLRNMGEFELFLDELLDFQVKDIFSPREFAVIKGLIQVKFKFHSIERRIQFLSGLMASLQGKKTKGEVILAIANHGGIPFIKLLQILTQRKVFVKMEEDPAKGEELNTKVSKVKSDADPILKVTIFKVLEARGILGAVKAIGRRLGSASIKQVHKLLLKEPIVLDEREFTELALKVKRPSALKHLSEDFNVTERMLEYFNEAVPDYRVSAETYSKAKEAINEELDFEREMQMQRTIAANMAARNSQMRAPVLFTIEDDNMDDVSDEDVMITLDEFIDGKVLASLDQENVESGVYYRTLDEFLAQVFVDGEFHADLHDGNEMEKGKEGILIDFGSAGKVTAENRKPLFAIFEALLRKKIDKFFKGMRDYGVTLDAQAVDRIRSTFAESKNYEQTFESIFLILNDYENSMPKSLFMFFQAASKVGKRLDNISLYQQVKLYAKYKFLVSLRPGSFRKTPAPLLKEGELVVKKIAQHPGLSSTVSSENASEAARPNRRDFVIGIGKATASVALGVQMIPNQTPGEIDSATIVSSPRNDKAEDVGGIDLNPTMLDLQTQGHGLDIQVPINLQNFQSIPIEGFSPIIIQIVPANLPLIFGVAQPPEKQEVSLAR